MKRVICRVKKNHVSNLINDNMEFLKRAVDETNQWACCVLKERGYIYASEIIERLLGSIHPEVYFNKGDVFVTREGIIDKIQLVDI